MATTTVVAPSLKTTLTPPTTTRFGVSLRQRRGRRCASGTGNGAEPAGGKAIPALVADKPFLHRERALMPFVRAGTPLRSPSPPPVQSRTSPGGRKGGHGLCHRPYRADPP